MPRNSFRLTCRLVLSLLAFPFICRATEPILTAASPFSDVIAEVTAAADNRHPDTGNRVTILDGGYDALLARVHLIRHARKSISLQTFIWANDECGRLLMYELIEAARRGVRVRIIADHMFSEQNVGVTAFLATVHPNLELKHYRPAESRIKPGLLHRAFAGLKSFHAVNQRMHNKVMVVDDAVLITGGRNIENTYYDHSTGMNFRDRDVLAVGPVARVAAESFEEFWEYRHAVASGDLTDVAAAIARGGFPRFERRSDYDFGGFFGALDREADDSGLIRDRFTSRLRPVAQVEFISDVPGKARGMFSKTARITRELRRTLEGAEQEVLLQTPYLVLSNPAQELFREMQRRKPGLQLRVSSNSFASTDNLPAYSGNYRLRNVYVEDLKLRIHEYKPRPADLAHHLPRLAELETLAAERIAAGRQDRHVFLCLHAKSLVVDGRVAFVGSYNLDPRSENLNTEVGLLVRDEAFARDLRERIERDMRAENSWVIAKRDIPLGLDGLNSLISGVLSLGPVDVWPVQNTSSFELVPGKEAVPPGHADFFRNYREVGPFPGAEGSLSNKEILTRLLKAVGPAITPIL